MTLGSASSSAPSSLTGAATGAKALTGIGPVDSALGFLGKNPSLALGGAGLLKSMSAQNKPVQGEQALQLQALQAQQQGAQLQSYLNNGTLPPGVQSGLDSAHQAAVATIKSQYAARGQSGSSAEQQDIANVAQNVASQGAQIATQLMSQGLQESQMSASIYEAHAGADHPGSGAFRSDRQFRRSPGRRRRQGVDDVKEANHGARQQFRSDLAFWRGRARTQDASHGKAFAYAARAAGETRREASGAGGDRRHGDRRAAAEGRRGHEQANSGARTGENAASSAEDGGPAEAANGAGPLSEWGRVALTLAAIGGHGARASLTASLNAAASAVKGMKEGNKEAAEQAYKTWEVETRNAETMMRFQADSYKTAMAGITSLEEAARVMGTQKEASIKAQLTALLIAFQDPAMAAAAKEGLPHMVALQHALADTERKFKERTQKIAELKAESTTAGQAGEAYREWKATEEGQKASPQDDINMRAELMEQFNVTKGGKAAQFQPVTPEQQAELADEYVNLRAKIPSASARARRPGLEEAVQRAYKQDPNLTEADYDIMRGAERT